MKLPPWGLQPWICRYTSAARWFMTFSLEKSAGCLMVPPSSQERTDLAPVGCVARRIVGVRRARLTGAPAPAMVAPWLGSSPLEFPRNPQRDEQSDRRNFAFSMRMNAFVKASPSEVARNSLM